ncbi:hypothetical protein SLEP1_g37621 [Rubroshorea leprosula]|uniref:Pentatricopeptide repeat-containing protein n=1 Tax=Rubroshorea leprosula TaxID=152421 RepID=A0AAV5KW41_9ROSI|nr:hypothetical protein SLEP1_g37621 [Rubroshorea leprosula]
MSCLRPNLVLQGTRPWRKPFPVPAFHAHFSNSTTAEEGDLYSNLLSKCAKASNWRHGAAIHAKFIKGSVSTSLYLHNYMLNVYVKCGDLVNAHQLFDEMPRRNVVTWSAIIAGFVQQGFHNEALALFCRMVRDGMVKPNEFTLVMHAQLVKSGHGDENCVGNSLVDMYMKNQRLADGFRAFQEMPQRDVSSWTQMAVGCLQCGKPGIALEVIAEMRKTGVKPNRFTLATAFNACAILSSWEEGKKLHGLRIKLGTETDVCVDNALLDMYAKCGSMDAAWTVFQLMNDRSIVSWTTMIVGCAQNGQARKALKIFDEMILEGIEPNYVTFICLLYACSQGGFIDEGWKYFFSMSNDHGLFPGEDHYACMVNLLGRGGLIKEAEELILAMPFKPGMLVWQTLLGAYQLHGDIQTGKRAAERAMNLDKKHPSSYVLLSNMFAGLNNWLGVGDLRELMETSDVKKIPGSSWIEDLR